MKLVRYGPLGQEKPGLLDSEGSIRDLSSVMNDVTPEWLDAGGIGKLAAIRPASLPIVAGRPRLGVPVAHTQKFIAIGLNYRDHAIESNLPIPSEPVIFTKAISCLQG